MLHEQAVVVIEDYFLTDLEEKWKPIPQNRRMGFRYGTEVHEHDGNDTGIPLHKFCLIDLADIGCRHQRYEYYIDVIGVLVGISDLTTARTGVQRVDVKREITISSEFGWWTRVILWGVNARNLRRSYFDGNRRNIVLIITSAFVEINQGAYCLSSTEASKVYVDLDVPEVQALKERYTKRLPLLDIRSINVFQKPIERTLLFNRMSFAEAYTLTALPENLGMTITVKGTIKGVVMETEWYYVTCSKCFPAHGDIKAQYRTSCDCKEPFVEPRLRLELDVFNDDSYGTTRVTVEGNTAAALFDSSKRVYELSELMNLLWLDNEELLSDKVPALRSLDNRQFVFGLEVIQQGASRTIYVQNVYPINHELEDKYELEQQIERFRSRGIVQEAHKKDVEPVPPKGAVRCVKKLLDGPLTPSKAAGKMMRCVEPITPFKTAKKMRLVKKDTSAKRLDFGMQEA